VPDDSDVQERGADETDSRYSMIQSNGDDWQWCGQLELATCEFNVRRLRPRPI
jgi:hypothetical protein